MTKTRVFNYPWHIAHQRELCSIPETEWFWLIQHRRQYSAFPRGDFFPKDHWIPHYESGKYDFALLHLDQQCFEESLWERGKGSLFREVNDVIKDIPKVCIMHGTPYYPETFACDITEENYAQLGFSADQIGMSSELIKRYKEAIKDIDVLVFNSITAKKQWGYGTLQDTELQYVGETSTGKKQYAIAIWHGMNADEWWDLPKEPRVVTMISPAGLDMYYDRTLLRAVREILLEKNIQHCHITVDAQFKSWDEYRTFLGRSLIYFNPTKESPMPRSRTEAMFSGCCIVTTKGQDVESFIKNDENGIILPRNPQLIADVIEGLIYDYKKAQALGQKAKETAIQTFSMEKFYENWNKVIHHVTRK